jgi:hypothetical protein
LVMTVRCDLVVGRDAMTAEARMEDWLARWHRGEGRGKPLHEWLGLTWEEYCSWAGGKATDAATVALILCRKGTTVTGGKAS